MTEAQDISTVGIHNFDEDPELASKVRFMLGGEVYEGVDDLPSELAMDFAAKVEKLDQDHLDAEESKAIMRQMLQLVLRPESAARFIGHLSDPENPIGNKRLKKVIPWLFEQYAERPTQEESDSSNSSENQAPGTPSLASTQPEALTSGVSG